jgi:cysteine desulfurase
MSEVALSSGSACSSGGLHASYVLLAMGVPEELAHSAVRFGVGRFTTEEEVDYVADKLAGVVTRLREQATNVGACGVVVKG